MLCQKCKKNSATVHLTEIVNGEKREMHLCESCATDAGVTVQAKEPINQLVAKFILAQSEVNELSQLTCEHCGMTFLQFRNGGLLGCPYDYQVFSDPLKGLLERAHEGNIQHVGKIPGGRENKHKRHHELMLLKKQLQEAVELENYEQAAALRDKIKAMER